MENDQYWKFEVGSFGSMSRCLLCSVRELKQLVSLRQCAHHLLRPVFLPKW